MPPDTSPPAGRRMLMVGDSLSVGAFGASLQDYFLARYGRGGVALYASCGSSPEHWLLSGRNYITKCGYRELTSRTAFVRDFQNGRPPQKTLTPKFEELLLKHRPTTVVIQLGTNWMDGFSGRGGGNAEARDSAILDQLIAVLRRSDPSRQIIWITPPDSSHYPSGVERIVENLIKRSSRKHNFDIIVSGVSSGMTRYVRGKSGGDGIHYNTKASREWAGRVRVELDDRLK